MFIQKRFIWYLISAIILVIGIIPIFKYGIKFDVDFLGGTMIQIKFDNDVSKNDLLRTLKDLNLTVSSIAPLQKNEFRVKIKESEEKDKDLKVKIYNSLTKISKFDENSALFLSIQPIVGNELKNKTAFALVLGILAILVYIWFAFRRGSYILPSYYWGIAAIIALVHDSLITLGMFTLFSDYSGYEFSIPVAAALLTILGYTINDTIIIFDRVRENLIKEGSGDFGALINHSIIQTISRSINTHLVTLIVVLAILFYGSTSLIPFAFTLAVGIFIGTFTSLFIASPILYDFYLLKLKKQK